MKGLTKVKDYKLIVEEYFANGLNQTAAYAKYYPNANRESARSEAYKFFTLPYVKDYQEKIRKENSDLYKIRRDDLIAELQAVILDSKNDTKADRHHITKCIDMIAKLGGLYENKLDITSAGEKLSTISIEIIKPKED